MKQITILCTTLQCLALGQIVPEVPNLVSNLKDQPRIQTGQGAPAGECTAQKDLYIDRANRGLYFCNSSRIWATAPVEFVSDGTLSTNTPEQSRTSGSDSNQLSTMAAGQIGWEAEIIDGTSAWHCVITEQSPLVRCRRVPAPPTTVITDFQAGNGFSITGSGCTETDDTTNYVVGTQSARVNIPANNTSSCVFEKSGYSLNLTNSALRLKFSIEDWGFLSYIGVAITDNKGVHVSTLIGTGVTDIEPSMTGGAWVTVTIPGSLFSSINASVDLASITNLGLNQEDYKGCPRNTVNWQGIDTVPMPSSGVIAFVFDDGYLSNYTYAAPYLAQYGYKATILPIRDVIMAASDGSQLYLNISQLQALHDQYHWEIGIHSDTLSMHNSGFMSSFAGNTTAGSLVISNVTVREGTPTPGQSITGPGIPPGATIVSYSSGTVTLASGYAATATGPVGLLSSYTVAQVVTNVVSERGWCKAQGWECNFFAWPLGQFTDDMLTAVRPYFPMIRTFRDNVPPSAGAPNNTFEVDISPFTDPSRIRQIAVFGAADAANGDACTTVNALIDEAMAQKQTLVFTLHNPIPSNSTTNATGSGVDYPLENWECEIDHIHAMNYSVKTTGEILDEGVPYGLSYTFRTPLGP